MIPVWIIAIAFCAIAILTKSRTYYVLAAVSVFNAILDNFTRADDPHLLLIYSSISFVAFAAVARWGDINIKRNLVLLTGFILVSFIAEYSLSFGTMAFIESGLYEYSITGLTIALLIGAGRGLDKNTAIHRTGSYYDSITRFSLFNHPQNYRVEQGKGKR